MVKADKAAAGREQHSEPMVALRSSAIFTAAALPSLETLVKNWKVIRDECAAVQSLPLTGQPRAKGVWGKKLLDVGLALEEPGWVQGWTAATDEPNTRWTNYGLVVQDNVLPFAKATCPRTTELLSQLAGINVAGFSRMQGFTELGLHTDTTGLPSNSLAFHIGLDVPDPDRCFLVVEGERVNERNGLAIAFDSSRPHFATNSTDQWRTILYVDISLDVHDLKVAEREDRLVRCRCSSVSDTTSRTVPVPPSPLDLDAGRSANDPEGPASVDAPPLFCSRCALPSGSGSTCDPRESLCDPCVALVDRSFRGSNPCICSPCLVCGEYMCVWCMKEHRHDTMPATASAEAGEALSSGDEGTETAA